MKKQTVFKLLISAGLLTLIVLAIPFIIRSYYSSNIYNKCAEIPPAYTCIVMGAKVYNNGQPSKILADRLQSGIELYNAGKVTRFLLSGDHGTKGYDEVNNMRLFLMKNGIKGEDIFMDHAGFNTYSSMIRAKKVFDVKDAIIVTQRYHLYRSIFLARSVGIKAYGYSSNLRTYPAMKYYKMREYLALFKAVYEAVIKPNPKFLGPQIPIKGESYKSWDH